MAMADFDVDQYLARISYDGRREPTLGTLAALHLAHLMHVPFENLHVFHRVGVRETVDWSYSKIVEQRRGGWCFELNGCFAELLRRLGFDVDLLSCRTFDPSTGGLSPAFDHLALLVRIGGDAYLVDVGWGDNPLAVIPADSGEHATRPRPSRIESDGDVLRLIELVERVDGDVVWELQYEASRRPRALADFSARSRYLQTEPGLNWTEKPLLTRATSPLGGRVTLSRDRLRVRSDDLSITDRRISAEDWADVLQDQFGMTVPTAPATGG
jgi:N-hydroxyarylamine O-acetyltransferase